MAIETLTREETSSLEKYLTQGSVIHVELQRRGYLGAEDKFRLLTPPHPHKRSDALYFIDGTIFEINDDGVIRRDRIYSSIVPAGSKTSCHSHGHSEFAIRERYILLKGELEVSLDGEVVTLNEESRELVIEPGVIHQARTTNKKALLLIIMENGGEVEESELHKHLDRDLFDDLPKAA